MISKAPPGVDMSAEAIDRRLRTVSELYQFAITLKAFKRLGKARDLEAVEPLSASRASPQDRMEARRGALGRRDRGSRVVRS